MKAVNKFSDIRFDHLCAYCAGTPDTRDHVPSRILLEKPYPENLPVVPCCDKCNKSFSLDEEYVACLIECVLCGSTEPEQLNRDVIRTILKRKPALRERLTQGMVSTERGIAFRPEWNRVEKVMLKQLNGHVQFENSEARYEEPDFLLIKPLNTMSSEESVVFWEDHAVSLLPELGSRGFHRAVQQMQYPATSWQVVQAGGYQYAVDFTPDGATRARVIVRDYLACMALWGDYEIAGIGGPGNEQ